MARKPGKKYTAAAQQVEARALYSSKKPFRWLRKSNSPSLTRPSRCICAWASIRKHADQMVRGTVVLPNGLGKSKKVLVIASGDKLREAQEAGADFVGGEEMVTQDPVRKLDRLRRRDRHADMMRSVGRLGKVLGPRGLMPNPKTGTVTTDVAKAVKEVKAGKVEFRVDKTGVIHVPVGKVSFDDATSWWKTRTR